MMTTMQFLVECNLLAPINDLLLNASEVIRIEGCALVKLLVLKGYAWVSRARPHQSADGD